MVDRGDVLRMEVDGLGDAVALDGEQAGSEV